MASNFGDFFGKKLNAEQLFVWGVLGEIIAALGEPGFTALRQLVNSIQPSQALSAAEAVDAFIKGHLDQHTAQVEATYTGIDDRRFKVLADSAGEPPGLETLLEAFRRGFIEESGAGADSTSLEQGIRESRIKNKWIETLKRQGIRPLPLGDAIDAWVEGQISPQQAQEIAYHNGISADNALILFHTRGRPPDPSQLIEMVRRGKIPLHGTGPDALSLEQGIFESAVKDKWEPIFEELVIGVPPPRTVVALVRAGTISDQDAARFLQDAGLSPDLAAAYIAEAHHTKTAAERQLSVTTILNLYEQRVISVEVTRGLLHDHGYTDQEINYLTALRDLQREIKAVDASVQRIIKLYTARKIDRSQVVTALDGLHIPSAQREELLAVADQERGLTLRTLTPAEVVAAWANKILDQAQAIAELVGQGFTPFDAWVLLSIRNRGPLPNQPALGPAPA